MNSRNLTAGLTATLWQCRYLCLIVGLGLSLTADLAAQPKVPSRPPGQAPNQPPFRPVPGPPRIQPGPPFFPIFFSWYFPALALVVIVAAKRKREQEEEEVTLLEPDSTVPFEYKIIRSCTATFKCPVKFRAILAEEARAGWELLEKLDDKRARLKRLITWREKDSQLSQNPYRTKIGMSQGILVVLVILGILLGIGAVILGILLGTGAVFGILVLVLGR